MLGRFTQYVRSFFVSKHSVSAKDPQDSIINETSSLLPSGVKIFTIPENHKDLHKLLDELKVLRAHEENQHGSAVKVGTTVLGLLFAGGCVMVLWAPSHQYADTTAIGKYLTAQFGFNSWSLFFVPTALEVGITNAYFAKESFPKYITFIKNREYFITQILAGLGLPLFAATQTISHLMVAIATGASFTKKVSVGVGYFAPGLYSATSFLMEDIPAMHQAVKRINAKRHASESDKLIYAAQTSFRDRMQEGYLQTVKKLNIASAVDKDSVIEDIFDGTHDIWSVFGENSPDTFSPMSMISQILRYMSQFLGATGAFIVLANIVGNVEKEFLKDYLEMAKTIFPDQMVEDNDSIFKIAAASIGPLVSLASIYFISKFLITVSGYSFDAIYNKLHSKPIDWTAFQMNSTKVFLGALLGVVISIPTYETIYMLANKLYNLPGKDEWLAFSSIDIDIVHAIGFAKMLNILILELANKPNASLHAKAIRELSKKRDEAIALADPLKKDKFYNEMRYKDDFELPLLMGSNGAMLFKQAKQSIESGVSYQKPNPTYWASNNA